MACVNLKRRFTFNSMEGSPCKRTKYTFIMSEQVPTPPLTPDAQSTIPSPHEFKRRKATAKKPEAIDNEMMKKRLSVRKSICFDDSTKTKINRKMSVDEENQVTSDKSEDEPLFTLADVTLICMQKMEAQRITLSQHYNNLLESKFAEQYDTFVKFTHDQILRKSNLPKDALCYLT